MILKLFGIRSKAVAACAINKLEKLWVQVIKNCFQYMDILACKFKISQLIEFAWHKYSVDGHALCTNTLDDFSFCLSTCALHDLDIAWLFDSNIVHVVDVEGDLTCLGMFFSFLRSLEIRDRTI